MGESGAPVGLLYRCSIRQAESLGWGERIATAEGRAYIAERIAARARDVLGISASATAIGWALVRNYDIDGLVIDKVGEEAGRAAIDLLREKIQDGE